MDEDRGVHSKSHQDDRTFPAKPNFIKTPYPLPGLSSGKPLNHPSHTQTLSHHSHHHEGHHLALAALAPAVFAAPAPPPHPSPSSPATETALQQRPSSVCTRSPTRSSASTKATPTLRNSQTEPWS